MSGRRSRAAATDGSRWYSSAVCSAPFRTRNSATFCTTAPSPIRSVSDSTQRRERATLRIRGASRTDLLVMLALRVAAITAAGALAGVALGYLSASTVLGQETLSRASVGCGTKGPRLHDWAFRKLGDVDASEYAEERTGLWTRALLIRRTIADGGMAFFSTWCPVGTRLKVLVAVEGHRWAIEDGFEAAKNELGLDHNETRSWHGWHRHVSLVMLAFAMLAAIRHRANATPLKKTSPTSIRRQRR